MSAIQPVGVYALRIPPGDVMIPAVPEFAAMFRVTMAAIDPTEEPELEDADDKRAPRATLKLVRVSDDLMDADSEDELYDEMDEEDEMGSSGEEENGGPSIKKSRKEKLLEALQEDEDDEMDDDDDDDDDDEEIDPAAIKKLLKDLKGKAKAVDGESDDDDDDEEDDSEEGIELDECVICTLDPEKHYQQPLDFVVNEGEKIFFKVSGTHTIHLTGNYVTPVDDGQASLYDEDEDEDEDYDLSPDEDELDELKQLIALDEESDELDDIEDPRITEVDSEEDASKAVKSKSKGKGKNKRAAEESDEEAAGLDALMAESIQNAEATNGASKNLSKADKKKAKKLKKNDGEAAAVEITNVKKETQPNGEKKVQFAKEIVQGPTPSAAPPTKKDDKKKDEKKPVSLGVRDVQGVGVDDRKLGSGPAAKKGSKLEMRYIGKLENGKVFDSNKSGAPFKVKVGVGEVIKGWDIGLIGMSAGGERRLTVPAHLAYGSKALPGIPKNSKLVFDVKCLSVK